MYINNEYPWQIVDLKLFLFFLFSFINTAHLKKRKLFTGDKFDSTKVYFIKCFGPQILWYRTLLSRRI